MKLKTTDAFYPYMPTSHSLSLWLHVFPLLFLSIVFLNIFTCRLSVHLVSHATFEKLNGPDLFSNGPTQYLNWKDRKLHRATTIKITAMKHRKYLDEYAPKITPYLNINAGNKQSLCVLHGYNLRSNVSHMLNLHISKRRRVAIRSICNEIFYAKQKRNWVVAKELHDQEGPALSERKYVVDEKNTKSVLREIADGYSAIKLPSKMIWSTTMPPPSNSAYLGVIVEILSIKITRDTAPE